MCPVCNKPLNLLHFPLCQEQIQVQPIYFHHHIGLSLSPFQESRKKRACAGLAGEARMVHEQQSLEANLVESKMAVSMAW